MVGGGGVGVCAGDGGGGGIPSDYFVSTQQLWLFCFWGCGCCWAVTITHKKLIVDTLIQTD